MYLVNKWEIWDLNFVNLAPEFMYQIIVCYAKLKSYRIHQKKKKKESTKACVCAKSLQSCLALFATWWTVTYQAPLAMGFSRQEHWSGLPCPSTGDLPDPGIEPGIPHCRQTFYRLSHQGNP